MAYRSRYARSARKSRYNFFASVIIIIILLYVTITWVLPPFINGLGVLTSIFKGQEERELSVSENPNLAPPVLNIPYEATNSGRIDIAGFATANSKVKIYLDDALIDSMEAKPDGRFLVKNISLVLGTNNIFGKVEDDQGRESLPSKTIKLIYDNEEPPLEVSEPLEGQTFQGERIIKVSGKSEYDSTVNINGVQAILESEGKFNHKVTLSDGENIITIKAHDLATNITEIVRKVTFNP